MKTSVLFAFVILGVAAFEGIGADPVEWPQWRGPNRDGKVIGPA